MFARAAELYDAQIVKKIMIKMLNPEDIITNLTEYAPYHNYHDTAIEAVVGLLKQNFLHGQDTKEIRAWKRPGTHSRCAWWHNRHWVSDIRKKSHRFDIR